MRQRLWFIVAVLLWPGFLWGCNSRSTEPEKIDREIFDKRKMPNPPPGSGGNKKAP